MPSKNKPTSEINLARRKIRDNIRALRRAIPAPDRAAASAILCQKFLERPEFHVADRVAGFLAFDGEADPLELMINACQMGKQVFVPIIVGKGQPLLFSPWSPSIGMKKNSFGIAEPDVPRSDWISASKLDFVITPLVAFDDQRNRLGVGGGYYDRSFAFLNETRPDHASSTSLIGFAFELQRMEALRRQPWDVTLHAVITEFHSY